MTDQKKPGNAAVIKKFFGTKQGQTMTGFMEELRELTPEDKEQLANGINDGSLNY